MILLYHWSHLIVTVPKKAQPLDQPQKCLCEDYCTLKCLLPPVVKDHCKVQDFPSLVSLPEIDELYNVLNGSTVYSSLDCILLL